MANGFYKVGADERKDQIVQIGYKNWLLIFGFFNDEVLGGYNWRKNYDHKPTNAELKTDLDWLVNSLTDEKILSGFVWNGKHVWLSTENQMNYKAAYDLAVQTSGATLPVKFKLGEYENGDAVYHTFEELSEFTDFYTRAIAYVYDCLNEGWQEKDSIDYDSLLTDECAHRSQC